MIGEVRVVDDVPGAFAGIVAEEMRRVLSRAEPPEYFRLGASGSSSGARCFSRLAEVELDWSRLAIYFIDERCVPADSDEANQKTLRTALGPQLSHLASFSPMSCEEGASAYEGLLRRDGLYHLAQLGVGPDGHTASLFPNSAGLDAAPERLVIDNVDPSGLNVNPRLSLSFTALAEIPRLVFTVMGEDKAEILAAIDAGADLPAARVDSVAALWLCDEAAASGLAPRR